MTHSRRDKIRAEKSAYELGLRGDKEEASYFLE